MNRRRNAAFYVETALTLFFLLCTAAVIIQLFSAALQNSRAAAVQTRAEFAAQQEAERLAAAPSPAAWAAAVTAAGGQVEQGPDGAVARLLLDESGRPCDPVAAACWAQVTLAVTETGGGRLARAQIAAGQGEETHFSLETGRYWPGEEGTP